MSEPLAVGVSSDNVQVSTATAEPEIDFSKTTPIPDNFIKIPFLCCAFTCTSCSFPSCFGCKGNTQCLCLEEEGFCCKSVKQDKTCCICFADSCEIVTCPSACRCYRQICCFEYICGCPFQSGFKNTDVHFSSVPNRDGGEVTDDSRPCAALCCELSSCYLAFPGCLSVYSKSSCICIESESVLCKPMCCSSTKRKKTLLCLLQRANCSLQTPTTCCKSITQCFCLDSRCAFPCDKEVPCLFMPLPFCSLCANFACKVGCCLTVGELTNVAPSKV